MISRYMASSDKVQWKTVKWILCYLKDTIDIDLLYGKFKDVESNISGCVDSDYVGDLNK